MESEKNPINTGECVIVACEMLEYELKKVMDEKNVDYPVVWIERGLHEQPDKLRGALQKEIDAQSGAEFILLAYGLCGNAVAGLKGGASKLVVPRFDDCIRMFMSMEKGVTPDVSAGCMYYTKGWIESDSFLLHEIEGYHKKYGPKKAKIIAKTMFQHYHGLRLIDTGAYNPVEYMDTLKEAAARLEDTAQLEIDTGVCPGTVRVLEKLLTRQWDDEFFVISPGGEIRCEDFWNL